MVTTSVNQIQPKWVISFAGPQYRKAFSNQNNVDTDNIEQQQTTQTLIDIPLSLDDVLEAIKDTGSHSAPGPDRFPAVLLHECKDTLSLPILHLWRQSLDTEDIAGMFWSIPPTVYSRKVVRL